ncbi:DUF4382 domain-containing protein [Flavisolibacter sp. BT320]|nr:DUF4382 domain-containing protein [Flavisolibacter longurius]
MKTKIVIASFLIVASLFYVSCKKDNGVPVKILLTDQPAAYDKVNVHIIGIRVKTSQEESRWIDLDVNEGVYDLLTLRNGVTTELANGELPDAILKEVRFILGTNNTVVVNGVTYPLTAPSAEDAGLKVKIDKDLQETLNTFTLDFDAALSVKEENGGYKLLPVIKLK